jgi:hypothetical protein
VTRKKKLRKTIALDGTIYVGDLAEPIKIRQPTRGLLTKPGEFEAKLKKYAAELTRLHSRKMSALLELYSVDPSDRNWGSLLAIRLAFAHVPGFRPARQPGAPRKAISPYAIRELVRTYLKGNPGKKHGDAYHALTGPNGALSTKTFATVRRLCAGKLDRNGEWK